VSVREVRVVAALIPHPQQAYSFLIQQRLPNKSRPELWEFPGGKVELGEDDSAALARECEEELGVTVAIGERLGSNVHTYPELKVELVLYRAQVVSGVPKPLGALQLRYATLEQMKGLPFCEADLPLLDALSLKSVSASVAS
jgi:8-oxo-dGTP diphosphatase